MATAAGPALGAPAANPAVAATQLTDSPVNSPALSAPLGGVGAPALASPNPSASEPASSHPSAAPSLNDSLGGTVSDSPNAASDRDSLANRQDLSPGWTPTPSEGPSVASSRRESTAESSVSTVPGAETPSNASVYSVSDAVAPPLQNSHHIRRVPSHHLSIDEPSQGTPDPGPPDHTELRAAADRLRSQAEARGKPHRHASYHHEQQQQQQQQQQYASAHSQDQRYNVPATPDRNAVPQLHFEAPSPNEPASIDSRAADRAERYGYANNGRKTPVPMAGIEETPEPQEHEQSDYFGGGAADSGSAAQYATHSEDGQMTGPTTPSSHYGGDWKADSQQHGGYDYIKQEHQFDEQQDPYAPQVPPATRAQDAYAPQREYPPREGSRTPSAPQPPRTQYASPQSRAQPSRAGARKAPALQQEAPSAANAYSPYAPQAGQYGQQTQRHEEQKPYDPYGARTAPAPSDAESIADLGLERRTAPVVSFGFGGRMVLVFPQSGQPSYGIDAANPYGTTAATQAQSTPSTVHVRKLDELVPSVHDGAPFPGPIFLDGGKSNANKKRKEALAWVSQRIGELEQEVSYARGAAPTGFGSEHAAERRAKVESRLLLVKLIKVMLENEGKIVGS